MHGVSVNYISIANDTLVKFWTSVQMGVMLTEK